jgi:hypothetical protein
VSRTVRITALAVALLVALGPLLPEEHVHLAGIEGRTHAIAHSHWVEESQPAGTVPSFATSHGDHGRAVFLITVYEGAGSHLAPSAAQASSIFVLDPGLPAACTPHAEAAPQIHAPPGRPWLTRGPPSLA